ncbi:VanZ family protein [Aestuariibaculum sediminum]|uniref:VanZ family protein n=1 Tax=Aestuariibaculum sediminum TaxID=2770637 RepID=A0A8J6Q3D6_9FLAO|nr:VanZ family protein [Aestuariibaculum sediminum]MBD0833479.1 VanZ family protein [Aestuariibaculum sediminum]
MRLKEVPDLGVSFADKIFHALTYLVLALLWYGTGHYKFGFKKLKSIIYSALFSIIFGIVIEVLQGMVTETRKPDLYDVIANTSGVLLAVVAVLVYTRKQIKK